MMGFNRVAEETRAAAAIPTGRSGAEAREDGALDDSAFSFTLDLVHPRVGGLIRQTATLRKAGP